VVGLEASRRDVAAAVCTRGGETVKLRADIFVLAAGALETPRVLLNSVSGDWPRGLANDSGLVGKNLMRHFVDLFAVQPSARDGHPGNRKEIAFNDFYFTDGQKLGTVQSFGALPPASVVVAALEKDLRDGQFSWTVPLFRAIKPGAKYFLKSMLDRRILFATIMEDLPYDDNSVSLDQAMNTRARGQIRIDYRIRDYDRGRIDMFRARVRDTFRPYRMTILKQAENNERLAHACGTCRFGSDPRNSVLDRNNRCHNLNNLYIADASFFPSSGGTNPGLTIAANALRVAKRMAAEPRL
jgi:choline dehydrogenase-like flavoprotein